MTTLRIGTRRSQLALWQTHHVRDQLHAYNAGLTIEIVHMTTLGDRVLNKPLPEIGGKGLFTQELEEALRSHAIDLAVHSLKDLPTEMDSDFVIGAILPRACPFDVLISRAGHTLDTLPLRAAIGTSSLRRRAQLLAHRADLTTAMLRGNVDTRVGKALDPNGPYDAIILAAAGLERLGYHDLSQAHIPVEIMLPAPGQGAIAVQCRADDSSTRAILAALDDAPTRIAVTAERAFLARLDAGCKLPVAAFAELQEDGCHLTGRIGSIDGQQTINVRAQAPADEAADLGTRLAEDALMQGADQLLADIRAQLGRHHPEQ